MEMEMKKTMETLHFSEHAFVFSFLSATEVVREMEKTMETATTIETTRLMEMRIWTATRTVTTMVVMDFGCIGSVYCCPLEVNPAVKMLQLTWMEIDCLECFKVKADFNR